MAEQGELKKQDRVTDLSGKLGTVVDEDKHGAVIVAMDDTREGTRIFHHRELTKTVLVNPETSGRSESADFDKAALGVVAALDVLKKEHALVVDEKERMIKRLLARIEEMDEGLRLREAQLAQALENATTPEDRELLTRIKALGKG
jgi:hypothetical protein